MHLLLLLLIDDLILTVILALPLDNPFSSNVLRLLKDDILDLILTIYSINIICIILDTGALEMLISLLSLQIVVPFILSTI